MMSPVGEVHVARYQPVSTCLTFGKLNCIIFFQNTLHSAVTRKGLSRVRNSIGVYSYKTGPSERQVIYSSKTYPVFNFFSKRAHVALKIFALKCMNNLPGIAVSPNATTNFVNFLVSFLFPGLSKELIRFFIQAANKCNAFS